MVIEKKMHNYKELIIFVVCTLLTVETFEIKCIGAENKRYDKEKITEFTLGVTVVNNILNFLR